ncbi:hypothetical protein ACVWWG_001332 [Bradyrhizobium sp. LB7.2]
MLASALTLFVPGLLVDLPLQRIALQGLVLLQPAVGLDHLQRIGRGSQHVGKEFVGIERDRRDQRFDLLGLQKLGGRCRRICRLRLRARGRRRRRLRRRSCGDRHHQRERHQGFAGAKHHRASIALSVGQDRAEARALVDRDQRNGPRRTAAAQDWRVLRAIRPPPNPGLPPALRGHLPCTLMTSSSQMRTAPGGRRSRMTRNSSSKAKRLSSCRPELVDASNEGVSAHAFIRQPQTSQLPPYAHNQHKRNGRGQLNGRTVSTASPLGHR